jgi:PAS domain S-box-containing protein
MFGNLRTGTKLFILSGMFIVAIAVTTYSLVADKAAAVNFTRKELAGSRYLAVVRDIYGAVVSGLTDDEAYRRAGASADATLAALAATQTAAAGTLQTAELAQALDAALRELWSDRTGLGVPDAAALRALSKARGLAARISDDSNLAVDTDLDSGHLVTVVVGKIPPVFGALAEAQTLLRLGATEGGISIDRGARLLALESTIRSTIGEIGENLAAAYRGNGAGGLQARLAPAMAEATAALEAYLSAIDARLAGASLGDHDDAGLARAYGAAADRLLQAWSTAQSELERLLHERTDRLTAGMARSLAVIGVLVALSILLLIMTHRHIVRPLERLERLARRVRETKDYGLRFEHANQDEIGRVAGAFNGMLAELSAAHELDVAHQVRAAEEALGLLVGVTAAASSAATEAALASACLEQICKSCEWHFGQVWYPDEWDQALRCSAESFYGGTKHVELRALSLRTALVRGQGLPGRVWVNKRAVWMSQRIEDETNLPRLAAARATGIKAAFAFPVMLGDKVLAVFEFLSEHTRAPERAFLDTVEKLGRILGDSLVRKRSEAALRVSEERWRSVFEHSTFGLTLIDPSMRYLRANAAFQAMMGYSEAELRERTPMDISLDEDKERSRAFLTELNEGKRKHYVIIKRYRRKDGTLMWGESYVSVIPGSDGKPLMFLGSTVDMTERKRAEDALQATQAELARVQRSTIMGEITASIAHEINQPLAAIVANANSGLRWLANKTPDLGEAQTALRRIVSDGHRAGEVIGSIRAMFKRGQQENAYYDVNALIREVLALVNGELETNQVVAKLDLGEGLPRVLADRVALQQVVLNLMMNAIEAMGSLQNGAVRVLAINSEVRDGRDILITVKDTGPGIDPENIDRIFDRFFTTKSNGMGMGLSICRSIVEAHHGRLWAEPDVRPGSVFRISLPIDGASAPA